MEEKSKSKSYFATKSGEELAGDLLARIENFDNYVEQSGLIYVWQKSYRYYHSQDERGYTAHRVGFAGSKNQKLVVKFNHFRSIVRRWRGLAQAQRASLQPIAKFEGYESEIQVDRGRAALDHYMVENGLEEGIDEAIELSTILGAAFLFQCWNPAKGEPYMPTSSEGLIPPVPEPPGGNMPPGMSPPGQLTVDQNGQPSGGDIAPPAAVMTGDLEVEVYTPLDLILDVRAKNPNVPWMILRSYKNKFAVAARYAKGNEKLHDQICNLGMPAAKNQLNLDMLGERQDSLSDLIPFYRFVHAKTEACPGGRDVPFLEGKLLLEESPLKYQQVHLRRVAPANIRGTPWGYTEAWDLLAPQEAADAMSSIAVTNAKTFGGGSMTSPKGSGVAAADIGAGLKLLEYNPGVANAKPEPLNVPQTPKEVWDGRKQFINEMGTIIGVNSTNRGDPEASLESGSALALVQAQGVESAGDFSATIRRFQEGAGTDTILIVQKFLKHEQEFKVMGEKLARLRSFSGKGVSQICRVVVKEINPLAKTQAGRLTMAENVAQRFPGAVTPSQYFRIVQYGELEALTRDASEDSNIDRENELLALGKGPPPKTPMLGPDGMPVVDPMTGQPKMVRGPGNPGEEYVRALITDDPIKHTAGHKRLLDSPAARENQAVLKAVTEHLQDHEELYSDLTLKRPALLEMLGIKPLSSVIAAEQARQGAQPGGQGQPPGGKPNGASPRIQDGEKEAQTPPGPGGEAKPPAFPKNPSNGSRYQPPPKPGEG